MIATITLGTVLGWTVVGFFLGALFGIGMGKSLPK